MQVVDHSPDATKWEIGVSRAYSLQEEIHNEIPVCLAFGRSRNRDRVVVSIQPPLG